MDFKLHPNFESKIFIADLDLCHVLLEDNSYYPWLILVPRYLNASKIIDLDWQSQIQLLKELNLAQTVLQDLFQPTQLNVAAIGNKTAQLHVHVIARQSTDPAWPQTVWDHPLKLSYTPLEKKLLVQQLSHSFKQ